MTSRVNHFDSLCVFQDAHKYIKSGVSATTQSVQYPMIIVLNKARDISARREFSAWDSQIPVGATVACRCRVEVQKRRSGYAAGHETPRPIGSRTARLTSRDRRRARCLRHRPTSLSRHHPVGLHSAVSARTRTGSATRKRFTRLSKHENAFAFLSTRQSPCLRHSV